MIKKNWIFESHDGLIVLSGSLHGNIGKLLDQNKISEAREELLLWKKIFQDRFYLEVQRYGDDLWRKRENQYIEKVIFLAAEYLSTLIKTTIKLQQLLGRVG